MRTTLLQIVGGAVLATAALAALVPGTVAKGTDPIPERLGFEVRIEASEDGSRIYECLATITDLDSGAVVSEPHLKFRAGEPAGMTIANGKTEVELLVSVGADERVATFQADVTRGQKKRSAHKIEFELRR